MTLTSCLTSVTDWSKTLEIVQSRPISESERAMLLTSAFGWEKCSAGLAFKDMMPKKYKKLKECRHGTRKFLKIIPHDIILLGEAFHKAIILEEYDKAQSINKEIRQYVKDNK